jgi:DNA-binding response OmpR family regulator
MRILVVEDEKPLAETLRDIFSEKNYSVTLAFDGVSGYDEAASDVYDVLVLDVMLPGMDGFTLLKKMRAERIQTPVLMLTARGETTDRVFGLDCGADYYLTKPFDVSELLACVRALLRRPGEVQGEEIAYGLTRLNPSSYQLRCRDNSIRLSAREFEMMRLLMLQKGAILSKERLLVKVWGYDAAVDENSVEVYASFLRKKLQRIRSDLEIKAVRRVGYHICRQNETCVDGVAIERQRAYRLH